MTSQLKVVEVFSNALEAEMARELLEASGIDAFVSKDDLGGVRPDLQLARGVRLLVRDSDVEAAGAILRSDVPGQGHGSGMGEKWTCTGCGENLEGQFTECWKCGMSRLPGRKKEL